MKQYSFLDYNNCKIVQEFVVGNYWIPSPKDAITGLKMYKRKFYTKPAANFIHKLRKGNKKALAVYDVVNGGILPAADMLGSAAVMNGISNVTSTNLPSIPLPGVSTINGWKSVLKDTPNQKAQKAKEFFKKPITKSLKTGFDLVTSPFVSIFEVPYYYSKQGVKHLIKIKNPFPDLLVKAKDGTLKIGDSVKFNNLPYKDKMLVYKLIQDNQYQIGRNIANSGTIVF